MALDLTLIFFTQNMWSHLCAEMLVIGLLGRQENAPQGNLRMTTDCSLVADGELIKQLRFSWFFS